jgi:HD-like signal output (HDOD) protein
MPSTTQEQAEGSTLPQFEGNRATQLPTPVGHDSPASPKTLSELDSLFCAQPVDLKQVSEAVRARPDLEALVLRLTDSLELSPDVPIATVEEAAVVLGRDRLRVLLHTWVLAQG